MTALALPRRGARFAALALPALLLPALLVLAGCASPETRLRAGLIDAGLSPPMAACMAKSMTDRLSTNQLRKLGSLHKAGKMDLRNTSYEQLVHQIRALGDPEVLTVTSSAAIRCALTT